MRNGFTAREQQLTEVKRSFAESEARNAAESRELSVMLQECRALPRIMPPSPRSPAPVPAPPQYPVLPPVPSVTMEEHQRTLKETIGPLESTISHLRAQCELITRDKQSLADEVHRLSGLVDHMQDEASDAVRQLPAVAHWTASSHVEPDTFDVVETVIHRLVSMGVFTPTQR